MSEAARALPEFESALPPGTRLAEFEVKGVLGVGGFGIVYLAFDHALEREVAVKEYMPASMAGRTETMHVSLRSQSDAEVFALGLRSFVNEAKLLARFDHPSLIKVHRFWEGNGTAYMAMPVLRGRTLKDIRRNTHRAPDEAWLRSTLAPLLGALEQLHNEGVYHRDIAPDNIHLEAEGRPVLLDFGAARRVITGKTQTLTAILKPAYAPIEQYGETGTIKQGPWTDLYALGATLHFMLLGHPPAPATARAIAGEATALAAQPVPGVSAAMLGLIEWMLAPRPADRPQNVAELRAVLEARAPLRYRPAVPAPPRPSGGPQPVTVPLADSAAADIELDMPEPPLAPGRRVPLDRTSTPPLHGAAHDALPVAADDAHRLPPPPARSKALPFTLAGLVVVAALGAVGWSRFVAPGGAATAAPAASAAQRDGAAATGTAAAPEQGAASETVDRSAAAPIASPSASAAPALSAAAPAAAVPATAAPTAAAPAATGTTATTPTVAAPTATAPTTAPTTTLTTSTPLAAAPAPVSAAVPPAARPNRAPQARPPEGAPIERPRLPERPAVACAGRTPVSQDICMERLCGLPRFRHLAECTPYRQPLRRREGAGG